MSELPRAVHYGMFHAIRHVAPVAAPIRLTDLARWAQLTAVGGDVDRELHALIQRRFGIRHSFLTSTGRAGLVPVLTAMRRLADPRRNEVVVPAYTCFSVPAAIVRAGLRPRIVDVSRETLDYDLNALHAEDFSRVLAIVTTNLYGLPNNLPSIERLARDRGVYLIDDAAQAMGASIEGRYSGAWGDAGLFSFDKGKNVSAVKGGIVVTQDGAVAAALDEQVAKLPSSTVRDSAASVVKALSSFVFLRPWLYGLPNRIPQLGLGRTVYSPAFPLTRPGRPVVALGLTMMRRLEGFGRARSENARALLRGLQSVGAVRTIDVPSGATAAYLRLPILLPSEGARVRVLHSLRAAGIGASGSYPTSIADIEELKEHLANPECNPVGARHVAAHIVTLPTHTFVQPADVETTVAVVAASLTS